MSSCTCDASFCSNESYVGAVLSILLDRFHPFESLLPRH